MRFGLLGTGYWAREVHATALAAHPGTELVAVWGRAPDKARALAADFGASAHDDVGTLLAAVDAVAIALPPDVQGDLALRAARAGKHLLLEKPLALSADGADRIVAEVQRQSLRNIVFHTARWLPEVAAWLEQVQAADGWYGAAVTWFEAFEEDPGPFSRSAWRKDKGALWDLSPHALDMLVAVLGPVEDIAARHGLSDSVAAVVRHRSGATSTMMLSLRAPRGAVGQAWRFFGAAGVTERPQPVWDGPLAYGLALDALLASGPDGSWPGHPSDVRHGRDIVAVIEAAARSLEQ